MEQKTKRIIERAAIVIAVCVALAVIAIIVFRVVTGPGREARERMEKSFTEMSAKLNGGKRIDHISLDASNGSYAEKNVPDSMFDDISCDDFTAVDDVVLERNIFKGDCITVFYEDGTYTVFFMTADGELYWGTDLRIECPSLETWYRDALGDLR